MKIQLYDCRDYGTDKFDGHKLNKRTKMKPSSLEKKVCEAIVEIKNADGLHMRPAMQFVDLASRFDCDITVSNNENSVDGKSIMQMSMLAATCGTKLKIKAEGKCAQEAVGALQELVEDKHFNEPTPSEKKKL